MTTSRPPPRTAARSRRRASAAACPDAKSTAPTITASVIAVPRSGSSRMRSRNTPSSAPIGRHSSFSDARRLALREVRREPDRERELRELRRLERSRGPKLTQRRAPLIGCATTSTAAQPSSAHDDERRRERAQPRVLPPRRDDHPGDAEHGVRSLPLEVRHRVRAADDGRRRRRAVDHHDSERRQRKRDERQDVPLRLSPHF